MGSDLPIGVVVGFAAEARVARRLPWPVAVGGGTHAGATAAAERLVMQGVRTLISFGLAGGLVPKLRPGALLVPHTVYSDEMRFPTDPHVSLLLGGMTPHMLYGANVVVATHKAKRDVYTRTGATAVDLESGAIARVAAAHHLPFAALRAICDPVERDLPTAALAALNAKGRVGILRMLRSLTAEPQQLPALLTLATEAAKARRALIARVGQIAQSVPEPRRQ